MKSVLFDFDGTLADTMTNHFKSWQFVLKKHQVDLKKTDYFPLEGLGLHEVAKNLTKKKGETKFIDSLVCEKKKYYIENFKGKVKLYDGVEKLIKFLKSIDIPIAIVTAGHKDQLEKTVPNSFLNFFNAIVTGDQILKNKPFPDPYLKAAELLDINANECIALENAPLGITSAIDAGCYCIAIASTVSPSLLNHADKVFNDFEQLVNSNFINSLLK